MPVAIPAARRAHLPTPRPVLTLPAGQSGSTALFGQYRNQHAPNGPQVASLAPPRPRDTRQPSPLGVAAAKPSHSALCGTSRAPSAHRGRVRRYGGARNIKHGSDSSTLQAREGPVKQRQRRRDDGGFVLERRRGSRHCLCLWGEKIGIASHSGGRGKETVGQHGVTLLVASTRDRS